MYNKKITVPAYDKRSQSYSNKYTLSLKRERNRNRIYRLFLSFEHSRGKSSRRHLRWLVPFILRLFYLFTQFNTKNIVRCFGSKIQRTIASRKRFSYLDFWWNRRMLEGRQLAKAQPLFRHGIRLLSGFQNLLFTGDLPMLHLHLQPVHNYNDCSRTIDLRYQKIVETEKVYYYTTQKHTIINNVT